MIKKSKFIKISLILCLILLLSLFGVSCGVEVDGYTMVDGKYKNDEPVAVVIIMGNHANAMAIPEDAYDSIEDLLNRAVYGGYVCAVVADGTPTKVEVTDKADFFQENARNYKKLEQEKENRTKQLINYLKYNDFFADAPEVDLLAAVQEAKNILSNSQFDGVFEKHIIIIDTGIPTSGNLDFTKMNLTAEKPDVQDIITQLKNYEGVGVLPDLKGIEVTFIGTDNGLAEVAAPQELLETDKKYLKELWTCLMEACGAKKVQFESIGGWDSPNVYTEDSESKFPYVSVAIFFHEDIISISEPESISNNSPDAPLIMPNPPAFEIKLESAMIGFRPDEAEYLNEDYSNEILRDYAEELNEFLRNYPDEKIWIIGTTATTKKDGDGSVDLSLERAETVKNTLVEKFNIAEENLLVIGLGAKFPWAVNAFPNGSFETEIAQENRAVWLLSGESDKVQDIENAYNRKELLPEAILRLDSLR